MARGPVFSGSESAVLVVGDSLVKYVGDVRCDLEVVSLPGKGVDSVFQWVEEHIEARHKLVVVHVGTNDLAKGVSVYALYNKLCALNALMPAGTQLCISMLFRRWENLFSNCWYSLPAGQLVRFNRNVTELNRLLSCSNISVLDHRSHFSSDRRLFGRDGLHLNRDGSYYLAVEIASYAKGHVSLKRVLLQTPVLDSPPLSMSAPAVAELIEFPPLGIPPPRPHQGDETLFRKKVSSWRSLPVTVSKNRSPLLRSPTGDLKTATGLLFTPK